MGCRDEAQVDFSMATNYGQLQPAPGTVVGADFWKGIEVKSMPLDFLFESGDDLCAPADE